jgi:hypothetical protein
LYDIDDRPWLIIIKFSCRADGSTGTAVDTGFETFPEANILKQLFVQFTHRFAFYLGVLLLKN